jgi:hypothetical protein
MHCSGKCSDYLHRWSVTEWWRGHQVKPLIFLLGDTQYLWVKQTVSDYESATSRSMMGQSSPVLKM